MKKYFKPKTIIISAALALAVLLTVCMPGCKSSDVPPEASAAAPVSSEKPGAQDTVKAYYDYDTSFLTLGKYKGLEITKDISVSDAEVVQSYYETLNNIAELNTQDENGDVVECDVYKKYKETFVTDRAAKDGDMVNITYKGYIDGELFSGGSAEYASLLLGSDSFIDGFEDAIIGKNPGETFDIDISFPDPYYNNTELSGKPVKFTTTLHYIYPEMSQFTVDIIAEAFIEADRQENGGENEGGYKPEFSTLDEFVAYTKKSIKEKKASDFDDSAANDLIYRIYKDSKFESYPQNMLDDFSASVEGSASQYGIDKDTYLLYFYGISTEEQYDEFSKFQVGAECVIAAIIKAENIKITDAEFGATLEEYVKKYNYPSADELKQDAGETNLLNMMLSEKVLKFIVDEAIINVVE